MQQVADWPRLPGCAWLLSARGFYVASTQDAIRIVKKLSARISASRSISAIVSGWDKNHRSPTCCARQCRNCLRSASTAPTTKVDWDRLILTLDAVNTMSSHCCASSRNRLRWSIGLQCYNVPGTFRENLTRSIRAWRKFQERE